MSTRNLANAITAQLLTVSSTELVLEPGYGTAMPLSPFYLTLTPLGQLSTLGNSEVVLCTSRSADTLTIVRAQKSTAAKEFPAGSIASNAVYIESSATVGDIFMSMRVSPAPGRLFMDGGTHNKADWPLMYRLVQDNIAYGTTGGTSGAETFTLADMRERMPFGKSQNSPFATLGNTGGSSSYTLKSSNYVHNNYMPNTTTGKPVALNGAIPNGSHYGFKLTSTQNDNQDLSGANSSFSIMNPHILVNYEVIAG